jgi:polysaccharide export outer membrane protein
LFGAAQSTQGSIAAQSTEGPISSQPTVNARVADDYQIGSGDVLQISVWKEPDVSAPSVMVRPDGMITVPLLKEIEVAGRTPRQVESLIVDRLTAFINNPNVTVVVTASNSKKVYVVGAVRREGTLPYVYRMTVMQALSEAGGLTDYAKRKRIYVIRSEKGRDYRLEFNYDEVVRGERMEQNFLLQPGDTLVVPR